MICDLIDSIELKVLSFSKTLSSFKLVNQQTNHLCMGQVIFGSSDFLCICNFFYKSKKITKLPPLCMQKASQIDFRS